MASNLKVLKIGFWEENVQLHQKFSPQKGYILHPMPNIIRVSRNRFKEMHKNANLLRRKRRIPSFNEWPLTTPCALHFIITIACEIDRFFQRGSHDCSTEKTLASVESWG
jgi:hypothetical protein